MSGTAETRQNDLMDIERLADRLGVGVRYVRRLVAERRVPFVKLGHLIRFDPADIGAWIRRAKVNETFPDRRRRRAS
jgi:excisionase family DNA binding protein